MLNLDQIFTSVEEAYKNQGHSLGWRFLYSPSSTLSMETKMLFIGLNPGGSQYVAPMLSTENGNAFRLERWGDGDSYNSLQQQVNAFFELIAYKLKLTSKDSLMDSCLTANYVPFRSQSWSSLVNQERSLQFGEKLWSSVLNNLNPSVIICLNHEPYKCFSDTLLEMGYKKTSAKKSMIGWGNVTYSEGFFSQYEQEVYLVLLPHFSRYKIIGKVECQPHLESIADQIVARLS